MNNNFNLSKWDKNRFMNEHFNINSKFYNFMKMLIFSGIEFVMDHLGIYIFVHDILLILLC